MNAVALAVGYMVLMFAGMLAAGILGSMAARWYERRAWIDTLIRHLAYEGALILDSERNRERAS